MSKKPIAIRSHEQEQRIIAQLNQMDELLSLRATLIGMFDVTERHAIAIQCRAYLVDYREMMKIMRNG